MTKKTQRNQLDITPQDFDLVYKLPSGYYAARIDSSSKLTYNGKPKMEMAKSGATFNLVVTYNITPEHTGPKDIILKPDDSFFVFDIADIYNNLNPPSVKIIGVAGGFAQLEASPIVTKARKVQHGS